MNDTPKLTTDKKPIQVQSHQPNGSQDKYSNYLIGFATLLGAIATCVAALIGGVFLMVNTVFEKNLNEISPISPGQSTGVTPNPELPQTPIPSSWPVGDVLFNEQFETPDPAIWFIGDDENWTGLLKDGAYELVNTVTPNDIKYIHAGATRDNGQPVNLYNAPISAVVKANFSQSPHSRVGILYRFDLNSKYYYALTLSKDGRVIFSKRNENGHRELFSEKSERFLSEGYNEIGIIGNGPAMDIYLNNWRITTIQDDELHGDRTGIIAWGTGEFYYDNFIIYEPPAASSSLMPEQPAAQATALPEPTPPAAIWKPGQEHPEHPNVIAAITEGEWQPAPGYSWVNPNNEDNLQVQFEGYCGSITVGQPKINAIIITNLIEELNIIKINSQGGRTTIILPSEKFTCANLELTPGDYEFTLNHDKQTLSGDFKLTDNVNRLVIIIRESGFDFDTYR